MTRTEPSPDAQFRAEYAAHRAAEGRSYAPAELLALPSLATGPLAKQWGVRARSFDAFVGRVVRPGLAASTQPLRVLDLGAGNGWLAYRLTLAGCEATALDVRDDQVDGLGAADYYLRETSARFDRVAGSFAELPLASASFDIAVFNASLHYAVDLVPVMQEVRRVVRKGGRIVILDSPFYRTPEQGDAMVADKRRHAAREFGDRAETLLALPFIEFLTRDRLMCASDGLGFDWRRRRVRYPLWYELRALAARMRRRRAPSRFDLWECTVP